MEGYFCFVCHIAILLFRYCSRILVLSFFQGGHLGVGVDSNSTNSYQGEGDLGTRFLRGRNIWMFPIVISKVERFFMTQVNQELTLASCK